MMKNLLFKEMIEPYYYSKKGTVRNYTLKTYRQKIDIHILPFFENLEIKNIDKKIITDWQNWMLDRGQTIKNTNKIRSILYNIIEYFVAEDLMENNPLNNVKRMVDNSPTEEMLFWTYDEFKKFIRVVDEPVYRRFYKFLYYTGCRKSEAKALIWKQIDFNRHVIAITRSLERINVDGTHIVNKPKNKMNRHILMNKELEDELYSYYLDRRMHFDFSMNEYVFGIDKPLADTTIEKKKNKYCNDAMVKQIRIHDFRHSSASLWISINENVMVISERLGHRDRNQTLNRYAHLFPNAQQNGIKKINRLSNIYDEADIRLGAVVVDFLEKLDNIENTNQQEQEFIESFKKLVFKSK